MPPGNGDGLAEVVDQALLKDETPLQETPDPETPLRPGPVEFRPASVDRLEARRDWLLARVGLMLIDAAKLLDPLTRIVIARLLALAALGAAAGLTYYTIRLTEGWERVAACGLFLAVAAWSIRGGTRA